MMREEEGAAITRLSDWEHSEQLYCSSEMTAIARAQRALGAYDGTVQSIARRALAPAGVRMADLSVGSCDDLLDGAARALVERKRPYQLRLSDRLAPFVPSDPIFARSVEAPPAVREMQVGPMLATGLLHEWPRHGLPDNWMTHEGTFLGPFINAISPFRRALGSIRGECSPWTPMHKLCIMLRCRICSSNGIIAIEESAFQMIYDSLVISYGKRD